MNSEKLQDTEPFKVLIVGEPSRGTLRMIESLREKYGERLEIIEDGSDTFNGYGISFIAMDEYSKMPQIPTTCGEIIEKGGRSGIRSYWRKGRW